MLREQGCQVAARTYRAWKAGRVAARTISDARVMDVVRELVWQTDPRTGRLVMAPEGLYGRRKMTALVRRGRLGDASAGSVDRAMRTLGLSGVRRDKHVRTTIPAKDGIRAGDLLNRDFTAPAPNRVWVTDFTYVRTWSPSWVYVAFIVDVFSQRILAWHASTSKATDLVGARVPNPERSRTRLASNPIRSLNNQQNTNPRNARHSTHPRSRPCRHPPGSATPSRG